MPGTPNRVSVGRGKFCYTGPTCRIHGTHWKKDAEQNVVAAKKKLETAETFEEFTAVKQEIAEAEKTHDKTEMGFHSLKSKAAAQKDNEKIQERYQAAKTAREAEARVAISKFLESQTKEEQEADVFVTKDVEKIELYMHLTDSDVKANLALNPNLTGKQLKTLSTTPVEKVQTHVALHVKTEDATLRKLKRESTYSTVKAIATTQLDIRVKNAAQARKIAEAKEAERARVRASYSYGGKGRK